MPQPRLPVIERIARRIESALAGITPAAGYLNTFNVRRRGVRGNAPEASQVASGKVFAVIIQPAPTILETESHPFTGWLQPFWIDLYVCPDEDNAESLDSRINAARADCVRALVSDANRTWGGLAIDTTEDSPLPFEGPGSAHGIQCRFIVQYRHVFYDPCQAEIDT
jgi:hypothetical protein